MSDPIAQPSPDRIFAALDALHRQRDQETRRVASEVLNALALAALVVGVVALAIMCLMWLSSADYAPDRDWPGYGWLVCGPALSAALVLGIAAEMVNPSRPS
jgi:FtsH-binding integral membrane protein